MVRMIRRAGLVAVSVLALTCADGVQALNLGVFGEAGYFYRQDDDSYFRIGHLDFYTAEKIDDRTRVLFEVEFLTTGRGFEVEIQRYHIVREFSYAFQLGVGRFHVPLGYWNRQYHHGKLTMPTVTRPFILGFERSASGFMPAHMIGLMAEGEIGRGLRYEAGIANSNSFNSSPQGDNSLSVPNTSDLSPGKSFFARLSNDNYRSSFKPGISFMYNEVLESAQNGGLVARGETLVSQSLVGVDVRYAVGRFDLLAELYALENDASPGVGDGERHTAVAWFSQFSYQLTDRIKATYRFEQLDYDEQDPYFTDPFLLDRDSGGEEIRNVFALRYDFSESNALKLELNRTPRELDESGVTTLLNWEFVVF